MRKRLADSLPERILKLGSRRHGQREGRLDGFAGIPAVDWGGLRAPSDIGFDALGALAQAQLGIDFYRDISRLQVTWQVAHRDLLHAKSRETQAATEVTDARSRLDDLEKHIEEGGQ